MKNVTNIDEFLYLVRSDRVSIKAKKKSGKFSPREEKSPSKQKSVEKEILHKVEEDNPYQLQIVDYQEIRERDK